MCAAHDRLPVFGAKKNYKILGEGLEKSVCVDRIMR
jgi:hypothetical protein